MSMIEDLQRIKTILPLLRTLTVRQAIAAGDEVNDACGLNPWCMNEGRADGSEPALSQWRYEESHESLDRAIAAFSKVIV
jgi:hypothetical protein